MNRIAALCLLLFLTSAGSQVSAQVSFAPEVKHTVRNDPFSVATADFNADGFDDIVVVNHGSNNISILINRADGTFGNQRTKGVGTSPVFVVPADLDGNSTIDLVVVNTNWAPGQTNEGSVSILLGNGDGSFKNDVEYTAGFDPAEVGVDDFDTDGIPDLVVGDTHDGVNYIGRLLFLKGLGDGTFADQVILPAARGESGDITVCHIDNDGLPDLLVSQQNHTIAREYLGNGDGTFTVFDYIDNTRQILAHTVGDCNADGIDDLALAGGPFSFPATEAVSSYRGSESGAFSDRGDTAVGLYPFDVATGDFDGDGLQDVVTANRNSHDISILLGRGDCTFDPEIRIAAGQAPRSIAAGDFTGDGRSSLVVANSEDDEISVFFNTGPVPPTEPVADAGPDQTVPATSDAGAVVTLDGSGSTDPDNDIILFEWIEDLGGPDEVTLGHGETIDTLLSARSHLITLRVTDSAGAEDVDDVLVVVTPLTPPDLTLTMSPDVLWPPNHRLVDIAITLTPGPTCTTPTATLVSFGSSESDNFPGDGDGNTTGDIRGVETGTEDRAVQLRAERFSPGGGRTYGLTYVISCEPGTEISVILTAGVSEYQSGVTEPLMIDLVETPTGTRVDWTAVPAATEFDVIRGDLSSITETIDDFELGSVVCVEANSVDEMTAGQEDPEIPPPGSAFFYLVEYWDDADTGYGTESAAKPRTPTGGGCI